MSTSGYLERMLERERKARIAAEALLEEKTRDLYITNEKLKAQYNIALQKQEKLLEYQKLLNEKATHDSLTGLPNRSLLSDRLERAIGDADRNRQKVAVVFIDLDNFKDINDELGHAAGDELLTIVSKRLRAALRTTDTLARLGGDEFVAIITNQNTINTITVVLQRILSSISEAYVIEGQESYIACSLGISVFPEDGRDSESLLRNADAAMYRSKEMGKNTFQFFTSDMQRLISTRLKIEHGLRHALENNEFSLVYQPMLSLLTNKIVGMEALLRWNSPQLGSVPPTTFIPVAEETGLIIPIGEWVLKTACVQNKAWQNAGLPLLTVSVNISPRQFRQANFIHMLQKILDETKLPKGCLELELTEAIAMNDPANFILLLQAIKNMGVKLSIDDFGTGYSSLSYLRHFPLDWLKIDRSFIEALSEGNSEQSIVKAIISLAHNLNMKVVAEGVETSEQLMELKKQNCDEIQGYYLSRPISPEEFYNFIIDKTKNL